MPEFFRASDIRQKVAAGDAGAWINVHVIPLWRLGVVFLMLVVLKTVSSVSSTSLLG